MNEVAKWLWYTDIVNGLNGMVFFLIMASLLGTIYCIRGLSGALDSCSNEYRKEFKILLVIFTILILLFSIIKSFLPSQRTMLFITSGKATQQVMATQEGQKAIEVLNKALNKYLQESQ